MQRPIACVACLTCLTVSMTEARYENSLAVNPIGFALGIENVEFARHLGSGSAMSLYWARSGIADGRVGATVFLASELRLTYRYHFARSIVGPWTGGSVAYSTGSAWLEDEQGWPQGGVFNLSLVVVSAEAGYRLTLGHLAIAPMAMARLPLTDDLHGRKTVQGPFDVEMPMMNYGLGIGIGWIW